MSYIIDRRLNSKNKSMVNRQRFLRRYKRHIRKAVDEAINSRSITDINQGETITIPSKDLDEPIFHHGQGGISERVLPGNKQFKAGDKIARPEGGGEGQGDGGEGDASNEGGGEDNFVFQISQKEFLDFMFDGLVLPNLVKRDNTGTLSKNWVRAGFSNEGSPGKINIVRSLHSANARRIALASPKKRKIKQLEALLSEADDSETKEVLETQLADLKRRLAKVPFIDDFDLKYNLDVNQPKPTARAVMFCIMDVSGSMTQATKDLAKRFFVLLYLFLQKHYEHTELVFIRHHTSAAEVTEHDFFYSRETGGTIVSSALVLMEQIIKERFSDAGWNIYGAQASDGDNWNDDSTTCYTLMKNKILPAVQHFSYVEITPRDHQSLWHEYASVASEQPNDFAMQRIVTQADIYPVFRKLFAQHSEDVI